MWTSFIRSQWMRYEEKLEFIWTNVVYIQNAFYWKILERKNTSYFFPKVNQTQIYAINRLPHCRVFNIEKQSKRKIKVRATVSITLGISAVISRKSLGDQYIMQQIRYE